MSNYEPQAGSIPAQVVGYFRLNPEEHLTLDDITTKFQAGRSNIHTLMARALDCELVKRRKDADGNWIYEAGPQLRPVNLPVFSDTAKPAERHRRPDTDMESMTICDDPLPANRASPTNKYVPLFQQLKPGQCIKCAPDDVARISHAMRKWIEQNKLPFIFRTVRQYHTDGKGRVWLLDKPADQKAPAVKQLRAA